MTTDVLKRLGWFFVFALAQALVLGRIHLFHCATPLLYVWFVILFPRNYPKWALLLWSFMLGFVIDLFYNTPGVACASMTLVAAIQPYFFELFVPRDSADNLQPSMSAIGPLKYVYYVSVLVLLYCVAFFTLEMFSFFNWVEWAECVCGSAFLTLALIFTFEVARKG